MQALIAELRLPATVAGVLLMINVPAVELVHPLLPLEAGRVPVLGDNESLVVFVVKARALEVVLVTVIWAPLRDSVILELVVSLFMQVYVQPLPAPLGQFAGLAVMAA